MLHNGEKKDTMKELMQSGNTSNFTAQKSFGLQCTGLNLASEISPRGCLIPSIINFDLLRCVLAHLEKNQLH